MRTLIALLLVGCFGSRSAQRIFFTSQDIKKSSSQRSIKAIHPHWLVGPLTSSLTVVYEDGRKQKVSRDSIWGFEDTNHAIYRSYKGAWYQVDSLADLIGYREVTSRFHFRYFSKGLDTPLYGTKRAARADTVLVQH